MSTERLTVAQYDQMIDSGALGKYDKVELVDGRLSPKSPRSHRHVYAGRAGFAILPRSLSPAGTPPKETRSSPPSGASPIPT